MKKNTSLFYALLLSAIATFLAATESRTLAQDDKSPGQGGASKPAPGAAPDMEEMMKKMQAFATPGDSHKALEALVGEWDVEASYPMGGPGAAVTTSKGTAKSKWILGGRYVQEEFTGEMMGRPFKGIGVTGYDNFRKKYVSTWMDDMGTGIFISEGSADAERKVFTFLGKMDEPVTGEKDKPTKYVVQILSPDKHHFEMHDLSLGDKSKVFEMTYTRKP